MGLPRRRRRSKMTGISRRHVLAGGLGVAAVGALGSAAPAAAHPWPAARERISGRRIRAWATDTWASLVAMTDEHRADRRQHRRLRAQPRPQRLHLADQHRRLPVERDRGPRPGTDLPARVQRSDPADAASRCRTPGAHEPSGMFYNWYEREDHGEADHLAGRRQPGLPVPVQRGQRLARRRAHRGEERRPGQRAAGPTAAPSPDELQDVLQQAAAGTRRGRD